MWGINIKKNQKKKEKQIKEELDTNEIGKNVENRENFKNNKTLIHKIKDKNIENYRKQLIY